MPSIVLKSFKQQPTNPHRNRGEEQVRGKGNSGYYPLWPRSIFGLFPRLVALALGSHFGRYGGER